MKPYLLILIVCLITSCKKKNQVIDPESYVSLNAEKTVLKHSIYDEYGQNEDDFISVFAFSNIKHEDVTKCLLGTKENPNECLGLMSINMEFQSSKSLLAGATYDMKSEVNASDFGKNIVRVTLSIKNKNIVDSNFDVVSGTVKVNGNTYDNYKITFEGKTDTGDAVKGVFVGKIEKGFI